MVKEYKFSVTWDKYRTSQESITESYIVDAEDLNGAWRRLAIMLCDETERQTRLGCFQPASRNKGLPISIVLEG